MTRPKFGISPSPEIAQQLDDLVDECVDLGAIMLKETFENQGTSDTSLVQN